MAGAPEGNKNSVKSNRLFGETIRRIAIQEPHRLRTIAEAIYAKAEGGDLSAAAMIGDRLDGKAPATLDITHREGETVNQQQARMMAEAFLSRAARTESVGEA